jgi:hypothetical protein
MTYGQNYSLFRHFGVFHKCTGKSNLPRRYHINKFIFPLLSCGLSYYEWKSRQRKAYYAWVILYRFYAHNFMIISIAGFVHWQSHDGLREIQRIGYIYSKQEDNNSTGLHRNIYILCPCVYANHVSLASDHWCKSYALTSAKGRVV